MKAKEGRNMPIPFMVLLLAVMLLGAGCLANDPAPPAGLKPPLDWPEAGRPAPGFSLPSLAGGEVTVPRDLEGRAVLMLFFSPG